MWDFVKRELTYLHGTFHDSETLLWARLQVIFGAVWFGLSTADLSPVITNPKYFSFWMIFNGTVSELLRRSRAEFTGADDRDTK